MSETFEVDLSGYVNTKGSYLKPGKYVLTVEDVEGMSSKAGNPMWKVTSSVADGPSKGETIVDFLTITQKAMFRVVAFLNAIGVPTPKKSLSIPKSMMVGKVFEATVDDDSYGGSVSSKIQSYASVAQPGSADLPDDDEEDGDEPTALATPSTFQADDDEEENTDASRRADQLDEEVSEMFSGEPEQVAAPVKTEAKPANARQQARAVADDMGDLDL